MVTTPQEIEVWYVLPSLRRALAVELKRLGLTQKSIAKALGITEAAVSQYIKGKRAGFMDVTSFIGDRIRKSAALINEALAEEKNVDVVVMRELQKLCDVVKRRNLMCGVHRAHGGPEGDCDICLKS